MRAAWLGVVLGLAGCAGGVAGADTPELQQAARNYPAMILGGNVYPTAGSPVPRACPPAGSVVEQRGGPAFEYQGADPANPNLCVMRVGGDTLRGWYAIWLTDWPGAPQAAAALGAVMAGRSGDVQAFDTRMRPRLEFHDLIRNEGIEDIGLLGQAYRTLKISHYREGFNGNNYRSVATVWKDVPSGMIVYATYQHISGKPEIDDPLIPTRIQAGKL